MKPRLHISFELILVVLVLVLQAYAVFAPANSVMNWFTSDDGFYYFKTAQNISEGYGITFDRIAPTNGFHPLWMMLLVPVFSLARFDLILPLRIVLAILALFSAGSAVLLYRLALKVLSPPAAAVVGLLWAFFPANHVATVTLGLETGINAFFTILLIYLLAKLETDRAEGRATMRQVWVLGIVATLVLLSRLDNIFLIGVLGVWVVVRSRPLRYLLLGDLVLALATVFCGYLLRLGFDLYFYYSNSVIWMAAAAFEVRVLVYLAWGLYDTPPLKPGWRSLGRIVGAVSLASGIVAAVMITLVAAGVITRFPRTVLLADWALAVPLTLALRWGVGWLLARKGAVFEDARLQMRFQLVWREWVNLGLRYYGPVVVTLLVYMAINVGYAGTSSPVSGQIKRWWGTIYTVYGYPEKNLSGVLGLNEDADRNPWWEVSVVPQTVSQWLAPRLGVQGDGAWALRWQRILPLGVELACAAVVLAMLLPSRLYWGRWANGFFLLPLLVGSFVQVSSYKMTTYVETLNWYWVTQMVIKTLLLGILLESIYQIVTRLRASQGLAWGISGVLGLILVGSCVVTIAEMTPWEVQKGHEATYLGGARGLEQATQPGDVIGSTGGGVIGYFIQDRTVVNLDGLINSYAYFQALKTGTAAQYLDKIGMKYLYAGEYMVIYSEPYIQMFKGRLKPLEKIDNTNFYRYH